MNETVFKRKFRWTIEGELPGGKVEPKFVKVAARPSLNIEEVEFKTNTWIPGKAEWEVLTVTAWEIPSNDKFWTTVTPSYIDNPKEYPPQDKLGVFKLTLYDGCGNSLEEWELRDAFITAMRFCELDHSASEVLDIELDIRYKNVVYKAISCQKHLPYTGPTSMGMGLGSLGGQKTKCPKCEHEFTTPGNCNIIF